MPSLSKLLRLGISLLLLKACSAARPGKATQRLPTQSSFSIKNNVALDPTLSIPRGGAVIPSMPPSVAAKIFCGTVGINGLTGIFTPEFQLKLYGLDSDDADQFMSQETAGVDVNIALLVALQLRGVAFQEAVGWSVLPYVIMTALKLFTGKYAAVGMPSKGAVIVLIINAAVAIASISGNALASPLIKIYAMFSLINGIPFLFAPSKAVESWGGIESKTDQNDFFLRFHGKTLLAHAVAVGLPAFGVVDGVYATVGWLSITLAATILGLLQTGKFVESCQTVPALVWSALLLFIAKSSLL